MAISKAQARWSGDLKNGTGSMQGASGYLEAPFTFASRFEGAASGTNPEELIGAAHAGCFSMFLSAQLDAAGFKPTSVETHASVHLGDGPAITKIELRTEAVVPGIDEQTFQEKVAFSKQNCPVSKALGAVAEIKLEAKLHG